MKKLVTLLLALALLACACGALAEGEVTVVQQNFHITGSSTLYGYLYLKLENTGDAPIRIENGEFHVFDKDGNELASSKSLWRYAEYLQPGEYTYAYFYATLNDVESADVVGDYTLAVNKRDNPDKVSFRLPEETVYEPGVRDGSWVYDYITTTFTNDTAKTAFDATVVRVLLDAKGNILYMDSDNMYSYKGLLPGSGVVLRRPVSSSFVTYFQDNGLEPTDVDCIAYFNTDEPEAYTGEAPAETEAGTEAAPAAQTPAYDTLQKGSKGDAVRDLQQRLKDLGYLAGKVDGDFGNGTAKAVTAFQKKAGLPETGVADSDTQKLLFADGAPAA